VYMPMMPIKSKLGAEEEEEEEEEREVEAET
jgi:hypothetical protein